MLIIEHNMEVIKSADYIIDLGPDGGDKGGQLVVAGTPEEVAACPDSITGHYLKAVSYTHLDVYKRQPLRSAPTY